MQYRYDYKGETHSIRLEKQPDGSYVAMIGETAFSFKASQLKDGTWLIDHDNQRTAVYTARATFHCAGTASSAPALTRVSQ